MPTGTKEVQLIKTARQPVAQAKSALEKGDLSAARKAWAAYDPLWNGMEVYVSFRSRPNYEDLELNWQAKITKALGAPDAKATDIVPMTQAMLDTWDKTLELAETGTAISMLFDEVAAIREARQPLRAGTAALTGGDVSTARGAFGEFARATWPKVQAVYKQRSPEAFEEVEGAIRAASQAFAKQSSTVEELTPLLSALNTKFGAGQTVLTQAARNDKG